MPRPAKVNAERFIKDPDMEIMFVPPKNWYNLQLEKLGLRECRECKTPFSPSMNKQFWCPACRARLWASANPV